jgi:ActR/RegA family two-component response regulator
MKDDHADGPYSAQPVSPKRSSHMNSSRDLILFVDDQAVARKYFSVMFGSEYDVLTASNADEAWTLIREHAERLAVVITDQRMPNHSGVDLLVALRRRHPRIVRMLTTGYADLDEAIDAVNRGDIYSYVNKPWNIDEFNLDIRRAIELFRLQKERDSLLDVHGSALRHALSADRLRSYGFIAATCAGWIERPLMATLAFWSDTLRYFNRLAAQPEAPSTRAEAVDQTRAIIGQATDIGLWLAMNRSPAVPTEVDAAGIVASVVERCGFQPLRLRPSPVTMLLDPRLLEAGLCALGNFFISRSALEGLNTTVSMGSLPATDGGLDVHVQAFSAGPASDDAISDPITTECLGLRGYLAVHHYGGSVSIGEWAADGGTAVIHIPPLGTERRRDATGEFHAAIMKYW